MATAKNKLPTFGANAETDNDIIKNNSNLKNTGFQPNTTIKSAEMNTYMKMLINGMSGLIDSVYNDGVAQNEIKADSTSEQVKDYIVAGLNQIIKTNKVDNATHADKATNVDAITNNSTGDNATVSFAIGDKTFTKKVNKVAHSDKAAALDSINIGDATHPVYFDANGKPVKIAKVAASVAADKLSTIQAIYLTGDATGSASFNGTSSAGIEVSVLKSSALKVDKQIGGIYTPVYINADGKPVAVTKINSAFMADKLSDAKTITIAGAVSGSASFDGSSNVTINTVSSNINATQMVDSTGNDLNVGKSAKPVYFANGKPVAVNMFGHLFEYSLIKQSNGTYYIDEVPDKTHFLAFVEIKQNNDNEDVYLSGIMEFQNGIPVGMLSGSFIYNQTAAASTVAFYNTLVYGRSSSKRTYVIGQAVYGDGHVDDNVQYGFISMTKLYQID